MANLNLDSKVVAIRNLKQSAAGWATRVVALLEAAFKSDVTPFGSASLLDAGTEANEVPQLDADGNLPETVYEDGLVQTKQIVNAVRSDGTASETNVVSEKAANDLRGIVQNIPIALVAHGAGDHTYTVPAGAKRALIWSSTVATTAINLEFVDGSVRNETTGVGPGLVYAQNTTTAGNNLSTFASTPNIRFTLRDVNPASTIEFTVPTAGGSVVIMIFGSAAATPEPDA